jgi:type VI secretion system secreted protein VgrG
MKTKLLGLSATLLLLILHSPLSAAPLGTAFTYQGRLHAGGAPANGSYDLRFVLYDAFTNGNAVSAAVLNAGTGVTNGLFTVGLDFGNVFNGSSLWLEVAARTNGAPAFTPLSPRQALTAAPFAVMANSASNLLGLLPAAQLSGTLPSSQLAGTYSGPVTLNNSANTFSGTFTGNGGGLTNLNAAALTGTASALTVSNLTLNGALYSGGDLLLFANGNQLENFFAGAGAGNSTSKGQYNTAIGSLALDANTSGGNNTASGYGALGANTTGSENTSGGVNALADNQAGIQNAALGAAALYKNTNGSANSAHGYEALFSNLSGSNNTASGYKALYNAGGSYNIGLGYQAGYNLTGGSSNIDIGHPGLATDTNLIRIGSGQSQTILAGVLTGNGSGLTNLNAAQLTGGVLPLAQLPAAVVTNGATNLTLSGTFSGNGAGLTNLMVTGLDDGGSGTYQTLMLSAGAFNANASLPFNTLSLVVSNSGAAPRFAFTLDSAPFGTPIGFGGHEAVSEPYTFVVEVLAAPNLLDPNVQLGRQGRFTFTRNQRTTAFAGLVTGCSVASYDGSTDLYTFRLESPLAWMALTTDYHIYQDSTASEMVAGLYRSLTTYSVTPSLVGSYARRPSTVQYAETALNFFSRLLEEDGIFYFFTLDDAPPTLILGDSPGAYLPATVEAFPYYGNTAAKIPRGAEFISSFQKAARENTRASVIDAYDFTHPATNLKQTTTDAYGYGRGTAYSFGAPVLTSTDIKARTRARQERQEVEHATMFGTANAPDLRPGYTFTLTDQTDSGLGDTYLVTAVTHAAFRRTTNGVASLYYGNQFQVIPASLSYRPALKTPKPLAQPCPAVVVGAADSEVFVDKYGRVKVQFQWDPYGTNDVNSSGWLRVASPWAGKDHGMMFLPRVGDEVLVGFVQGDPDQPYVTGSFYNAASTVPYALPASQTVSTIKSKSSPGGNGANEIRFEDAAGSEALELTAQKDFRLDANNDTFLASGNNFNLSASVDALFNAGRNLTLSSTTSLQLNSGNGVTVSGGAGGDVLNVLGTSRLNDYDLILRGNNGDLAHGLGWYGGAKPFGSSTVDGPVLYGCGGGALATKCGGAKTVLVWNSAGNVGIGTESPAARLHVAGTLQAAAFAGNGASLTNLSAANIVGVLPAPLLPAAAVTNGESGVTLSGAFNGSGAGLTNVLQNSPSAQSGNLNLTSPAKVTLQAATTSSTAGTAWYPAGTFEAGVLGSCVNAAFNAGVVGVDIGSTPNSAGVVGSYSSVCWGALGYMDVNSTPWAGYFNGPVMATSFSGSGAALTGLNASSIASGTLADNRLSTNIPLLNGSQTFTGQNHFTGGNVGIGTTSPTNKLHVIGGATFASANAGANQAVVWAPGSASWSFTSDRNSKANLQPVSPQAVLEKVAALPLHEWNYRGYEQRHIGPMAQDFHAAFPLNDSDTSLNDADLHGVALAAIQGLHQKLTEKDAEVRALKAQNETLDKRLKVLEKALQSHTEQN